MRILLAVNSAAASELLVSHARKRFWPVRTTAEVLCVLEPRYLMHAPDLGDGIEEGAEDLARSTALEIRGCGLDADFKVRHGDPKEVIVNYAREIAAEFIWLAGPPDKGGQFLSGSTTRAILRVAPCSVEIVRAVEAQIAKILLATDGSECSEEAARSIAARPWLAETEVRVLSAVELSVSLFQPPFPRSAMETIRSPAMQHSQDAIDAASKILRERGMHTSEAVSVLVDAPKAIILEEAARWVPDLIVVGSHGRRGVSRFLLGSVSEAVAMEARCSVEVIRGGAPVPAVRPALVQTEGQALAPSA
jgi:nucleotide-binding universal stress UspA family protein